MKILVLNQYFPPDRAATAILLGQLCKELSLTHTVQIVCASPSYNPDFKTSPKNHPQLKVDQVRIENANRAKWHKRIKNYFRFSIVSFFKALKYKQQDLILCWTDPPWSIFIAAMISKFSKTKLVWVVQDVYPDIAIQTNLLTDRSFVSLLNKLFALSANQCAAIVAIGNDMKDRLIQKGYPKEKIHVIENWQNDQLISPQHKSLFRNKHKIPLGAFVIMHSGNMGISQDFKSLLDCAEILKEQPDILFILIGDGGKRKWIEEQIQQRALSNVKMFSYQEEHLLSEALSAPDLHYVSLLPELSGLIVPSKIYGIAASQKAILANLPKECSLYDEIKTHQMGLLSNAGGQGLAQTILDARKNPSDLHRLGLNARQWFEGKHTQKSAFEKYKNLLEQLK